MIVAAAEGHGVLLQKEAVRQRLPDAVNPLLLGQNLRERLDSGALDLPTFEAAMAELKQAVRPARKP